MKLIIVIPTSKQPRIIYRYFIRGIPLFRNSRHISSTGRLGRQYRSEKGDIIPRNKDRVIMHGSNFSISNMANIIWQHVSIDQNFVRCTFGSPAAEISTRRVAIRKQTWFACHLIFLMIESHPHSSTTYETACAIGKWFVRSEMSRGK